MKNKAISNANLIPPAAILSIIFFGIKLLHANVQCAYIVIANISYCPSTAAAEVDRPMYAIS